MALNPYINIFLVVISLHLLYYTGRQRILEGIYAIGAYSILTSAFIGFSFVGFTFSFFRIQEFLIGYTFIVNLAALCLSYIKPIRNFLNKKLQSMWFISLLAILTGGILSIGFQYLVLSIGPVTDFDFQEVVTEGLFFAYLSLLTAYFCIPLYFFHMNLRKQVLISFQLEPLLSALTQELEAYKSQLTILSTSENAKENQALIHCLEENLRASKLPLYADSTDVSMALYPQLSDNAKSNTWMQVNLLPLPTAELAFLLTIICSYLNQYNPNLLQGVQLTPLTEGRIIFEIEKDILSSKHLQLFLTRQRLVTPKGTLKNHHLSRISLRYLLTQNHLSLKHVVMENGRQALVLYP